MKRMVIHLLTFAALLLAVPVVASAGHNPHHDPGPPGASTVSIAAKPLPVTSGQSTVISGQLSSKTAGVTVTLEAKPYPYTGAYNTAATSVTGAGGNYSFTVSPTLNTRYRAVASASPAVTSPEITVGVRMKVGFVISDTTPRLGQRIVFRGTVRPAHDGGVAHIQKRTSSGWRHFSHATLTDAGDARSVFRRTIRIRSGSVFGRDGVYRVRVTGHGDHVGGISRTIAVDVR